MPDASAPHPLDNPAWHAVVGPHEPFAETRGAARRYRADVSPFAAVDALVGAAWDDLAAIADGGWSLLARAEPPEPPAGWTLPFRGAAHQMVAGPLAPVPTHEMRALTTDDVPAMLALVELAKPGPFLPRTIELGAYVGVFDGDRLVAMAGERMHLAGHTEVSAVCTHPDARARGLAAALTRHVADGIARRGERAFLHVAEDNHGARRVYERLGFVTRRMVTFAVVRPPH